MVLMNWGSKKVALSGGMLQNDEYSLVTFCKFELKLHEIQYFILVMNTYVYVNVFEIEKYRPNSWYWWPVKREGKGISMGSRVGRGLQLFIYKHPFLLKTASKYMKMLANSGLWYMDILSYFLYFSVFLKFLKVNRVRMGTLYL